MGALAYWLLASLLVLVGVLESTISRRGNLGKAVLDNAGTLAVPFSVAGVSGVNCLDYLKDTIEHQPFTIERKSDKTGGSFDWLRRRMTLGQGYREKAGEAVLDAAHEFSHVLQVGPMWTTFGVMQSGSVPFSLLALAAALIYPNTPYWVGATLIFVVMGIVGAIPREIDAILGSLDLSLRYLATTPLDPTHLQAFERFAKQRARATAIWYPLSIAHREMIMAIAVALIATLHPMFLHAWLTLGH